MAMRGIGHAGGAVMIAAGDDPRVKAVICPPGAPRRARPRQVKEFLDLIARPRPFAGLTLLGVTVRILGDLALCTAGSATRPSTTASDAKPCAPTPTSDVTGNGCASQEK
jgi:hypothetical protein